MITRTSSPVQAISLSDAKRSLGVSDDSHDRDIDELIEAATNVLRRWTGRAPITTNYRLSLSCFRCPLELPFPPLASVTSVEYRDSAGVLVPITNYQVQTSENVPAILSPAPTEVWPIVQSSRVDAVVINYVAGPTEALPETKQFIRLLIRHWYDNPSAVMAGVMTKEVEFTLRSLAASLGIGNYAHV